MVCLELSPDGAERRVLFVPLLGLLLVLVVGSGGLPFEWGGARGLSRGWLLLRLLIGWLR